VGDLRGGSVLPGPATAFQHGGRQQRHGGHRSVERHDLWPVPDGVAAR
jgi:hypothetical protein